MKLRKIRNRINIFILAAVLFISGCGTSERTDRNAGRKEAQTGRYIEEFQYTNIKPEQCSSFTRLEDGSLAVFSLGKGPLRSADEGKTWEPWQADWYMENRGNCYFHDAAIAPDGTMFVVWNQYVDAYLETPSGDMAETEGTAEVDNSALKWHIGYQLLTPDGADRELVPEGIDGMMLGCWFAPDGTLYGTAFRELFEVSLEDGSLTTLFETKERVEQVCFLQNKLIAMTKDGAVIYDRDEKVLLENDEALDAFLKEKAAQRGNQLRFLESDLSYNVYAQAGKEDRLYFVCQDGIYAHTLGGGTMEKLVEGTLSRLGDPSLGVYGFLSSSESDYLVLYGDGVGRFSYHPDIPMVPEKELKVYSLEKDDMVQKAVSRFQQEHQDVYVSYRVGKSGDDGQLMEDVIKSLNTEILAGKGPDVLILDGLPLDAYMEKGMLVDLSDVLEQAKETNEYFENMLRSFEKEGSLYAIPLRCSIPVALGKEEVLENMRNLEDVPGAVASLRRQMESGSVMGGVTPYGTLRLLALSSAPSWEKEDGQMDEKAVEQFLHVAKQVYDSEAAGVTREEVEEFGRGNYSYSGRKGLLKDSWMMMEAGAWQVFLNENKMCIGLLDSIWGTQTMFSVPRQKEGVAGTVMPGQSEGVYLPQTLVGIPASAKEMELAKELAGMLLSAEMVGESGFPINKTVLKESLAREQSEDDGPSGACTLTTDGIHLITLDIYSLREKDVQWVMDTMESLRTPYLTGGKLESAVFEVGEKVLTGEREVPAAMEEIRRKVQLFLAE